ncbi:MAG TPA: hypothetical protein VHV83_11780, partial [Armatimonadota bacterium]|nr:hypothetical protein [Armatimonadota bacterium]
MARSIHTTRRDVEEAKRQHYADDAQQEAEVKQLEESLAKKQRVKRHSVIDGIDQPAAVPVSPWQVSIRRIDEGSFLHYPASPDDIRTVLASLPLGVLDGLDAIEYRLHSGIEDKEDWHVPDPLVGRRGGAFLPGVYMADCFGVYLEETARIWLLAFVYDPSLPDREMWELYLRLSQLGTLMHEVAHHYDARNRVAHGRWRADDEEHAEYYAQINQYTWTRDLVIPYLERAYPEQVHQFSRWLERHGGAAIPLTALIDEPGKMQRGQRTFTFNELFSLTTAVEELASDIAEAKSSWETRVNYALNLHYHEEYAQALAVIDSVLAHHPDGSLPALVLQADIFVHQQRYAEAEASALQVLAINDSDGDAWKVLSDIYEETRDARKLHEAVNRMIDLLPKNERLPMTLLYKRALARLWCGDLGGYHEDLQQLEC